MKYTNYVRDCALGDILAQEQLDHFDQRTRSLAKYENAVIVPSGEHGGGLYDRGSLVKWSNFNGREEPVYSDEYAQSEDEVLYIGMIFGVWGHCLTDFLRHVWPLLKRHYKIAYTTVLPNVRIPQNYFLMLNALGVAAEDIVYVMKPTRFKAVYFGEPSDFRDMSRGGRFFTQEYVDTIEAIRSYYLKDASADSHGGAIYFSRGGWKKGCVDFGEHLIEKAFREHYNCQVVHPEKLSLAEMIRLLSTCDTLIATEGSVAHNSLFMRRGSNLISIRKTDYVNWYQPMISQARDLNVTYIDANYTSLFPTGSEPWFGPFLLGVNKYLAEFLGCNTSKIELIVPFCRFTGRYMYSRTRRGLSMVKAFVVKFARRHK